MVNKWTRDDMPDHDAIRDADDMHGTGLRSTVIEIALDAVVEHLNAHHPKPTPGLLSSAADCVLDAEDRASAAKSEVDRWRRAHSIVEQERDQAREALADIRSTLKATNDAMVEDAERERDEWKARAEQAAARTAPAVTREDVEKAIDRWKLTGQSRGATLVDDLWQLLSGDDQVEALARDLWETSISEGAPVAHWEDAHEDAREQFRILARHWPEGGGDDE